MQGGSGSVYVFKTKQRNENPFLLVKFRQAGKGKKSPEGKKHKKKAKKEKKIVFLSVDKAGTGIIIMYKYGKEGGGERGGDENGFVFAFQSKQARRRVPSIGGVVGG